MDTYDKIFKPVGEIAFKNFSLMVYGDLNDPLFKASDVADIFGCDEDFIRKIVHPSRIIISHAQNETFITEASLYDILSQSGLPFALIWRHMITDQLVSIRKSKGLNIIEQFVEWNDIADTLYWDEEKGMVMQSVTVQGGDVEQVPYEL